MNKHEYEVLMESGIIHVIDCDNEEYAIMAAELLSDFDYVQATRVAGTTEWIVY